MTAPRFALIGAAGFVAPRHLQAIKDVGGKLVAALDPHDAVGVLDKYDRETEFFTEPERFERHLEMLRRSGKGVDWVSVCSPNHLHDVHTRLGMRAGANVICEKPLVLNPWNLDSLVAAEHDTGKRVFTVLQLRHATKLQSLQYRITNNHTVKLHYVTPRGHWYQTSWKGDFGKSGGLCTNIGIHMFDLLLWLFGPSWDCEKIERTTTRASGIIRFGRAHVEWLLSIDPRDAPNGQAERSITIDGERTVFSGFDELHRLVYEETLAGRGHGIEVARPAVELVAALRGG